MRKRRGAARLLVIAGVVVAVGVVGAAVSTVLSGRGGGTPAGKLDWERPESVSGDPFRFADLVSFGDDGTPLLSSPDPVAHAVVKYGAAYAQDRRNPTGAAPEALPDWFAPRVGEMVAGVAGGDPTEATELSELLLLERVADLPGTFVAAEDHPSLVDALTGVGSPETLLLRIELALALDDEAAADALVRVPEQDACTLAGAAPSNPDLGGYLAYEMLRPRYDCVTAAVDGMVAQWAAASGPQVLRAVVRGELVDAPGAEALVTTFADQNLAARSAIGFTPSDLVDQVLAELTLDRETDPLVYSSARRTLGTGAAVSDSISGDYALDAYLFAELDEATRFDVWAPAATPAAQVERAGGWEPLFALGAGFTPDDPDHPALVEQLAAGCGVTSPVDFTGREIPPFAVVTAVLADLAGESCDTLDVATAVELASESAAMPTAATPMFRAWVSAYAGCRYADGPPGDDAVRTAVADLVPDDEPAWSFRTDPTDYYAMFDSYATGWLDALTGDRFDCASLTPWGGTQPEPTFETTEPPRP